MPAEYEFSTVWFRNEQPKWDRLFEFIKPKSALEIGCFEGQASVYLIERCKSLTCVDTWAGSLDLPTERMEGIERRFDRNIAAALAQYGCEGGFRKIKKPSTLALAEFIVAGERFDLIYVDASHTAPDVLSDAVMAFHLLNVGGTMVLDDYLWHIEPNGSEDLVNMPKFAIDAFVNCNIRKVMFAGIDTQMYLTKSAE